MSRGVVNLSERHFPGAFALSLQYTLLALPFCPLNARHGVCGSRCSGGSSGEDRTPPGGSSPSDAPGGGDVDGRRAMNDGDAEAAAAAVAAAAAGPSGHNINNTDASFPAGLKVLLVDDDPMCLKVVAAMLER